MQCFCPSYIKSNFRLQRLVFCWGVTYALPSLSALLAVNSLQSWVARHIQLHKSNCSTLFCHICATFLFCVFPHNFSGAAAPASSVSASSISNFKLENTRAARLGVGASFVAHSASNSALLLGGKISGSIKRARSQKLELDAEEQPMGWVSTCDDKDSKCASIKRKLAVASDSLYGTDSIQKQKINKKRKKKKATASAESVAPVTLKSSPPTHQSTHQSVLQSSSLSHKNQELLHSIESPYLIPADSHKLSQPFQRSNGAVAEQAFEDDFLDAVGSTPSFREDLGSGLRKFHQSMRKRTKTRSKAKNLKKDKRPPELRPGGEK
jgi:hypothetical protein